MTNKTIKLIKTNKNKTVKNIKVNKINNKINNKHIIKPIIKSITKSNNKNKTFKKQDYLSGDGMLTSVWGPSMWHYLHMMSFNYPVLPTEENKKHYRDFILNLQNVLPCKYCRMNLKTNFKQMPLTMNHMKNRDNFSRYVYDLHEIVNKMLKLIYIMFFN